MKALTICQPYAHLCIHGDAQGELKRVENRSWHTAHRGPLYIHAGKSREWLSEDEGYELSGSNYGIRVADMVFGAIIGQAQVIDCVHIGCVDGDFCTHGRNRCPVRTQHPWLADHVHAEGPYCWVLADAKPLGPWPWKGAQGLWSISNADLSRLATGAAAVRPPGPPRVLNRKRDGIPPWAVLVDRTTKWGNPFRIGVHGDRARVLALYADWLPQQPDLMDALPELRGKDLVCCCAPEPCHAQTLIRLANEVSHAGA